VAASPKTGEVTASDVTPEKVLGKGGEANSSESEGDDSDDVEEVDLWDLKMVLTASQFRKAGTVRCATTTCDRVACCIWFSSANPKEPWYSCLDCQAKDFGGWPESPDELPIKVLGDDLCEAILEKCTKEANPEMPDLPSGMGAASIEESAATGEEKTSSDIVTSPENKEEDDDGMTERTSGS